METLLAFPFPMRFLLWLFTVIQVLEQWRLLPWLLHGDEYFCVLLRNSINYSLNWKMCIFITENLFRGNNENIDREFWLKLLLFEMNCALSSIARMGEPCFTIIM